MRLPFNFDPYWQKDIDLVPINNRGSFEKARNKCIDVSIKSGRVDGNEVG